MSAALFWEKGWLSWEKRLEAAPAVALFTDFDGTLSAIASRPSGARLPASTRGLLRQLSRRPKTFVAIVSGRPVSEQRRLVRLSRLAYIGIHGIEVAWPGQGVTSRASEDDRARIARAREQLEKAMGEVEGAWVEPKPASVAVHFRRAAASAVPQIEEEVTRVARGLGEKIVLERGKKVFELMPAIGASKARAVQAMLEKLPRWLGATPLPIYLGDDRTDETVFRQLRGGLTIHVGRAGGEPGEFTEETAAQYLLADPADVRKFLRELLRARERGG